MCSHKCWNTLGGYRCSCPAGFRLIEGSGVCRDIDECVENTHSCRRHDQECRNTQGGFSCIDTCPQGFHKAANGSCIDIDECHTGPAKCHYNQVCVNNPGGYHCACPRGFRSDGPNKPCVGK
ncbi:hypothetical protein NP493_7380g00000 [Ridgeia piscesae]|uniref:EGF-like domain-containing protein n=1 Tax=Ridgeia piscesae TaxID=27915 RepID=A0AAD9IQI0_RIDPI|nr:hypothetical protein NP493_7380g00000 [Ridgeia piscesae]